MKIEKTKKNDQRRTTEENKKKVKFERYIKTNIKDDMHFKEEV